MSAAAIYTMLKQWEQARGNTSGRRDTDGGSIADQQLPRVEYQGRVGGSEQLSPESLRGSGLGETGYKPAQSLAAYSSCVTPTDDPRRHGWKAPWDM